MENNGILGTVYTDITVGCPDWCPWRGTNVTHGRHRECIKTEVVTVAEALRRLGCEEAIAKDSYAGRLEVIWLEGRMKSQHPTYCGGGKVWIHLQGAYKTSYEGWMPAGRSHGIIEHEDGRKEFCTFA